MFSYKHLSACLSCVRERLFAATKEKYRIFLLRHICGKKYTLELMPEIEKDLDAGNMKHRKHPGVRKMAPIRLPQDIINSIYRLVSNDQENKVVKDSVELCKQLAFRRLPVEYHEVKSRFKQLMSNFEGMGNIPEIIKKQQLLQLKKQISREAGQWKPLEYDSYECLVYLAGRAAQNYASTFRVFSEIRKIIPTFQPKTFFDFGSGIGSSVWAANSLWADTINEYFCVDSSPEMIDISQDLLKIDDTEEYLINPISYRQFLPASSNIKYDLVVSAFSLLDLPSAKDRLQTIDTLWRKTSDMLVVIEYGNLAGFSTVMDARDYIIHIENISAEQIPGYSTGAYVVCPCPHDSTCPMTKISNNIPCGMTVSYESIFPRHHLQYKKDWISYVVLRKGCRPDQTNWPRIVQPVLKKSKHVYCRLCCDDGEFHQIIVTKSKHGRNAYRSAKSSSIGDLLPVNVKLLPTDDSDFPNEWYNELENDETNKT